MMNTLNWSKNKFRALRSSARRWARALAIAALALAIAIIALFTFHFGAKRTQAATTELFISEYIEGSSNNKAIEIYNGTGGAVNLSAGGYQLEYYFNGSALVGLTIPLTGTVANNDVYVVAQASANATILAQADQTNSSGWFNGDDAVVLRKGGSSGTIVDVIGQVGFDPGAEWGSGLTSTADNTLQRKSSVCQGDTNPSDVFNPATEWDGFATDTVTGLGSHTANCGTNQPVTPTCPVSLVVIQGTAASVNVSATDSDGVVTSAMITSVTPSPAPGVISLSGGAPAGSVGATATAMLNVSSNVPLGSYSVIITWSNNDATPQTATCTIAVTVVALTPIHDIQGPGASSPLSGVVTTRGIVTGRRFNNGFFIQEPDASVDADPATSEGIFVFTSSAPPAAAAVGNLVQVTGTITEFVPSADPLQPPVTELTSPMVTLISSGNPLPAPIPLTATFPDPAGPFDQLERLEGMRVSVSSLTVIAPTQGNVNEQNATATSNGVFYGVVTGVARPFREPGIQANDPAPSGSIPPIPRFDLNPERIRVDSDGQVGASAINVGTGAVVTNLVGPLDYAFRTYTVLPDPASPLTVLGGPIPTAGAAPASDEFTVASYNLERFFDTVNDPGIGEPVLTATAFNNRLSKASLAIRDFLRAPDILGVVEVENLTTLQALATKINNDAVVNSQPNPNYVAYLVEGNDVGGIDVGFLVKTAIVTGSTPRVTVNGVVQELDGTLFVNPNSSTDTLNDRPPLRLDATVNFAGGATFPVTVIVNHLRSLIGVEDTTPGSNGWATDGERIRAKRLKQAEDLANLVQARQTANPNERIILVGDFNAFEFNDGFVDMMNVIAGTPTPDNQTAVPGDGVDLVNPNLSFLLDAASQRYSFIFDGNAQSLDHILVNSPLISSTLARRVEHPRINSDFPEIERNNTTGVQRLADHDPLVSYYRVFQPITISGQKFDDLNGNGVKDGGETGLNGVTINLDKDANGSVDATTTTSGGGNYSFLNLGAGTYRIREAIPASYIQTTANPADIVAQSGVNISGVDFGNFNCAAITVNPATIPAAFAGSPYSQTFTQTTAAPVTWSLTGSLPSGLTFDAPSATISGTPGVTGVFNITVRATFATGCFGERAYTLSVNAIAGSIADPAVCNGQGGGVNVTATVTNFGANAQPATFKAELEATLLALPGTCVANVGTCTVVSAEEVVWAGTLQAGQTLTIKYQAQIADGVTTGTMVCVVSSATIGGGAVGSVKACATVNCQEVGPGALLPAKSEVSDQKAGSVLIYNIYTSSASGANSENTRINLTNVDQRRSAFVHLFFVDGETCSVADSYICLTPNQTTSFLASDVDPGTTGYVVALAVDDQGCPINFNYLIGDAYVKFSSGHAANLGAEAIAALAGGLPLCDENSTTATLNFDGVSYNRLPRALALSNIPSRADGNDMMLVLNRIGGSLATGAATLTNIFGIFYDDAEIAASFSFNPGVCQFRSILGGSFPRIAPRYEAFIPSGRTGWLKLYSTGDQAILGAAINFNGNAVGSAGAFNQGHNLHKLTLTSNASYTIPVFPPGC